MFKGVEKKFGLQKAIIMLALNLLHPKQNCLQVLPLAGGMHA